MIMADQNSTRSFMKTDYKDTKMDKSEELNESMTISHSQQDEYTKALKNIGGSNNG